MEATKSSNGSVIARTDIATNGDVGFVVGPHSKKIRVCSFILKNASTYFRAMFELHFAEGKDLKSDDPKQILILDDWNKWVIQLYPTNGYPVVIVGIGNLVKEKCALKGYVDFTKETTSVLNTSDQTLYLRIRFTRSSIEVASVSTCERALEVSKNQHNCHRIGAKL